jgi:hypothetical protein
VTLTPGGTGDDRYEVVKLGRGRTGGRSGSRALLACPVVAAAVTVAVQVGGHRPAAGTPPPVRVTMVGHRLLGVTADWQLLARGPADLVQIELARGRITQTYVPPLASANPDVALVAGARDTIIRSADVVPGYVVRDGQQARALTGLLAGGGPLVPGEAGTQTAWVRTGPPTSPVLSLVTLTGHLSGPVIRFPPDRSQLPATAVSDGRGDVLVSSGKFSVYDAGPGRDSPVPGMVVAVGPADWLLVTCDAQHDDCRNEVIGTADGSRRVLPGEPATTPYFFSWPPAGVIAPDGSTAALAENGYYGQITVYRINLRTGTTEDLGIPLGANANGQSMAWSPDSRWLFVAEAGGKLVAVSARTGRVQSLGVRIPAVDQLAIRS